MDLGLHPFKSDSNSIIRLTPLEVLHIRSLPKTLQKLSNKFQRNSLAMRSGKLVWSRITFPTNPAPTASPSLQSAEKTRIGVHSFVPLLPLAMPDCGFAGLPKIATAPTAFSFQHFSSYLSPIFPRTVRFPALRSGMGGRSAAKLFQRPSPDKPVPNTSSILP